MFCTATIKSKRCYDMENIKQSFSDKIGKKILGNRANALDYLSRLSKVTGEQYRPRSTAETWKTVVKTWNYEIGKKIIREMFRESEKYKNGREANEVMNILIEEWKVMNLGDVSWPFSQGDFDGFVQKINSLSEPGTVKDEKVRAAAVRYRRIKEINTVRNDYIETLIFEKNDNIVPTINHSREVDFFIDGVSYDQKVSKSVTAEFKRDYGDIWREEAIRNPAKVAEYLYRYQDEGRFGSDPRLLVVKLDEDFPIEKVETIIQQTDLTHPLEITFSYDHEIGGTKDYKVRCFVILLHN